MSVLRFVGGTSREAMRKVRARLGDDALIVANRRTETGVEILAMAEDAVAELGATAQHDVGAAPRRNAASTPAGHKSPSGSAIDPALARRGDESSQVAALNDPAEPSAPTTTASAQVSEALLQEIRGMRSLLAREQALRDDTLDCMGQLRRQLLGAGFSPLLAAEVLTALPPELAEAQAHSEAVQAWLVRQLSSRLPSLDNEDDFFVTGGVVALVGPTGVGKTTTTAKLAARFVMSHGPEQVALLSTDSFRIGAHEQLRIYAELLNVPLYALDVEQPLTDVLGELRSKKLVLIDTVGTSQRDQRVIEQIARLQDGPVPVRAVLLLNAGAQPDTLDEVITNYCAASRAAGARLEECLLTKRDEAARLGPVLDRVMREGLRMLFVSQGQRVPEDLSMVDAPALVTQALRSQSPPVAAGGEGPGRNWTQGLLSQGRRIRRTLDTLEARVGGFRELLAAWDLTALPAALRQEREQELLASLPVDHGQDVSGVLWSRRSVVPGAHWAFPDCWLDANGQLLVWPASHHQQPPGQVERLRWATAQGGANVHLLPGMPEPQAWDWLVQQGFPWICQVRGTQRVVFEGERRAMTELPDAGKPAARSFCRFRGQPAQLLVRQTPVSAAPQAKGRAPQQVAVSAWLGVLRAEETGRELGRRYWLAPRSMGDTGVSLLREQLEAEALPALARRLHGRLAETLGAETSNALRVVLASGLAMAADRIARSQADWAMDLRADLLSLLNRRAGATPARLADALINLCVGRETLQQLAMAGTGEAH